MEYRPNAIRSEGEHVNSGRSEPPSESRCFSHVDENDIGLDRSEVDAETVEIGRGFREPASVGMVVGQTFPVVLECVESAGSDDSSLTESTSVHLLEPAPAIDDVTGTGERRSDRGTETFREAHIHRVCGVGELLQADA